MTAATQSLHDQLDVEVPHGTGGNIHVLPVHKQGEGGLHPFDGEQLVGRLGRRDPHLRPAFLIAGDGGMAVKLRPGDDGAFLAVSLHAAGEHPLDLHGVRPLLAQIGGGLEGAHPRLHDEAAGIQHDAGQQGLGLQAGQAAARHVLHQLGHHFGGGGGIGARDRKSRRCR